MSQAPDDIHQHSGWLIPLGFMLVVAGLCVLFLLYYLRPGPQGNAPTGDPKLVSLQVGGLKLQVPANYLRAKAARAGGQQDSLALVALLPNMTGYSDKEQKLFASNAPDSPVLNIQLHGDAQGLTPEARLERIYRPYLRDGAGLTGSFGLTRYDFKPGSAYDRNDLFAGLAGGGLVLLLCEKPVADLPSPNCIATDRPLARGVSFSYRFKRSYLSRWAQIASGVSDLMARFQVSHQAP